MCIGVRVAIFLNSNPADKPEHAMSPETVSGRHPRLNTLRQKSQFDRCLLALARFCEIGSREMTYLMTNKDDCS